MVSYLQFALTRTLLLRTARCAAIRQNWPSNVEGYICSRNRKFRKLVASYDERNRLWLKPYRPLDWLTPYQACPKNRIRAAPPQIAAHGFYACVTLVDDNTFS
jgi:hypothetical protein